MGLASTVYQSGGLIGAAVCGLIIVEVGVGWSFLVTAGCFLPSLFTVPAARPAATSARSTGEGHPLRQGLAEVLSRPELLRPVVLVCFVGSCSAQLPVVLSAVAASAARDGTGGEAGTFGALCSALALGSMVGALLSACSGRGRQRHLVAATGAFGLALAAAALAPNAFVLAALLGAAGAASLSFLTAANATLQLGCDPARRGRVMSVYLLASVSGIPIGGPLVGWVTEQLGPRVGLLACGLVPLLAALVIARRSLSPRFP